MFKDNPEVEKGVIQWLIMQQMYFNQQRCVRFSHNIVNKLTK